MVLIYYIITCVIFTICNAIIFTHIVRERERKRKKELLYSKEINDAIYILGYYNRDINCPNINDAIDTLINVVKLYRDYLLESEE